MFRLYLRVYVRVLPWFLAAFLGCICSYIHICEYEFRWGVCACVANISGSVFRLYLCVYIYMCIYCVWGGVYRVYIVCVWVYIFIVCVGVYVLCVRVLPLYQVPCWGCICACVYVCVWVGVHEVCVRVLPLHLVAGLVCICVNICVCVCVGACGECVRWLPLLTAPVERWGAGVEYHFQEI